MKRELKRSIKEDELVSGFERAAAWVQANRKATQAGVIALVVLVGGGWGYAAWQERRTRDAEAAFASALEIFEAPLRSELPEGAPPPAGTTVYATAAEKFTKAAAAFDGIERRFGGHDVAMRARLFGALARGEAGDTTQALRQLEGVAALKGGQLEPALAQLARAQLLRKVDQPDKAAEAFRKLAGDPSWPLPKAHALMELAEVLEASSRPEEARATYQRIADEHPGSVYASEARRRAESLAGG